MWCARLKCLSIHHSVRLLPFIVNLSAHACNAQELCLVFMVCRSTSSAAAL